MKRLTILFVLVLITSLVWAQQVDTPKKDTLLVRVLNKYVLVDGKKTSDYYAAGQEFRDTLNRLLNVINFDDATHQPTTYSRYTYSGMSCIGEEHFANNRLVWRFSLGYDAAGILISKKVEKVLPGDTALYLYITYKNKGGKPTEEAATAANGKVAYKAKLTYDKQGELVQKKVSVKGIVPIDSVLLCKRTLTYDSLQRITIENLVVEKVNTGSSTTRIEYKFGKEGYLSAKTIYNASGLATQREEHIYNIERKRIQEVKIYDGSGNLLEWRAYRYERYGSQPYMVRVID